MPQNKRESLIFTILMCSFMVIVMSVYNVGLHDGFSIETIKKAWVGFPLAFIIAGICDWFIVSKVGKKIAFKIVKPTDKVIKQVLVISTCMVCGMVILMSLYGAIEGVGFSKLTLLAWMQNIPRNFIVAWPLQIIIAGPIVRFVFRKAFPVGTIVDVK